MTLPRAACHCLGVGRGLLGGGGFLFHSLLDLWAVGDLVGLEDGLVVHDSQFLQVVHLRDSCSTTGGLVRSGLHHELESKRGETFFGGSEEVLGCQLQRGCGTLFAYNGDGPGHVVVDHDEADQDLSQRTQRVFEVAQ